MVNLDGIVSLADIDTLPTTLSLFGNGTAEYQEEVHDVAYEVLQASLARTIRVPAKENSAGMCRVSGDPVYRVSGVGQVSAKPKRGET